MKHYLLILISVISVSCNNYYQELSFNYENASKDKMNDIIKIILEKDYKDQIYQKKYSYYTEKSKFNFKTNDIIPYSCYINNKNYDHVTFKHLQVVRTSVTLDLVEIFKNHCDIKENLKKLILNNNITLDENLIYLMTIKNKEYWTDFLIKNYKKNI